MDVVSFMFGLSAGLGLSLASRLTNGFTSSCSESPNHVKATRWACSGKPPTRLTWQEAVEDYPCTVFTEDLPKKCFDCGFTTKTEVHDYIGGEIDQFMVVVRHCVKGCGYSIWIA